MGLELFFGEHSLVLKVPKTLQLGEGILLWCGCCLWGRLRRAGYAFDETSTEFVGVDSCHGSITPTPGTVNEVVLRVGVRDADRAKVDRFGKELAPLVTSGPPGVTGFAGGRPQATEVLGYWPALIGKNTARAISK